MIKAGKALPPSWFARPVLEVAPDLLGKTLCRKMPAGEIVRLTINEVEAYNGHTDKACHASKGLTPRTAPLFGPPGHAYVYLCYGIHWLLNFVTDTPDYPAAVLIRGVGPYDGPGKLTKALAITKTENTLPLRRSSLLWIEDAPAVDLATVKTTPRIGVDYAGEPWVSKPWRWVMR